MNPTSYLRLLHDVCGKDLVRRDSLAECVYLLISILAGMTCLFALGVFLYEYEPPWSLFVDCWNRSWNERWKWLIQRSNWEWPRSRI